MSNIALFSSFGLSNSGVVKYSESSNSFIGNGYTSQAGNTYFNEFRFGEGILIKEDIGHGHTYTFLNGIRVYDLKTKELLCEETFNCYQYSDIRVKLNARMMLTNLVMETSAKEGVILEMAEVSKHVDRIVDNSYKRDQREMLVEQTKRYLNQ